MTSEELQDVALFLDGKADEYRDLDQPELAQKMRDATAALLDCAFPFSPGDTERGSAQVAEILQWLREFDARL